MSKIAIVTDSASDLSEKICAELGIILVPLSVHWGSRIFKDGVDLLPVNFYPRLNLEKDLPSIYPPTPQMYADVFNKLLAQGKDVICLTLSSGLHETYGNAVAARDTLKEPERVVVMDTFCVSVGEGLLAIEAARLAGQGLNLGEIVAALKNKISRLHSVFTIRSWEILVKGGRINAFQGGLIALMDIKPILHLDKLGRIVPLSKVRSDKKALAQLEAEVGKLGVNLRGQTMGVAHALDPVTGAEIAQILKEKYGAAEVVVGEIGPVNAAHFGPGGIAVFFYGPPVR